VRSHQGGHQTGAVPKLFEGMGLFLHDQFVVRRPDEAADGGEGILKRLRDA